MNNILVVDDEPDICALLTGHLRKIGFNASYCLTIREALDRVAAVPFDLIFVDLNLTDGSGYDLISAIRNLDHKAKIIVISAYDSERHRAIQSGANVFVAKPFSKDSISGALASLNFLKS